MIPHTQRRPDPFAPRPVRDDFFGPVARRAPQPSRPVEGPLAVGAKTLAGICLGIIGVVGGAAVAGVALETVIIPGLLIKLVGGIAGGSLGLAKGIEDERRHAPQESD